MSNVEFGTYVAPLLLTLILQKRWRWVSSLATGLMALIFSGMLLESAINHRWELPVRVAVALILYLGYEWIQVVARNHEIRVIREDLERTRARNRLVDLGLACPHGQDPDDCAACACRAYVDQG